MAIAKADEQVLQRPPRYLFNEYYRLEVSGDNEHWEWVGSGETLDEAVELASSYDHRYYIRITSGLW